MELDKRIKEGKRPLTCLDIEQAREFVGKECIFSDHYDNYRDIEKYNIDNNNDYTAILSIDDDTSNGDFVFENSKIKSRYRLILPLEWVKPEEPEKKYRPYSLNEFLDEHEIGDKITYRHKMKEQPENFIRHKEMICGYQIMEGEANTPGEGLINLGGTWVSLQAMFDDCETPNSYLYPEVWQPFGVIEDD